MLSHGRHSILIVDDHPMMREGLRTLISRERDLIVCGEAETAGQALDAVANLKPNLELADITLPGPNGIELIKDICALQHVILILVISMHDESLYAERVLRAGARGYIMKQESGPTMMQAIRQVLAGRIYLSDKMSARILEYVAGKRTEASPIDFALRQSVELFRVRRSRPLSFRLQFAISNRGNRKIRGLRAIRFYPPAAIQEPTKYSRGYWRVFV